MSTNACFGRGRGWSGRFFGEPTSWQGLQSTKCFVMAGLASLAGLAGRPGRLGLQNCTTLMTLSIVRTNRQSTWTVDAYTMFCDLAPCMCTEMQSITGNLCTCDEISCTDEIFCRGNWAPTPLHAYVGCEQLFLVTCVHRVLTVYSLCILGSNAFTAAPRPNLILTRLS